MAAKENLHAGHRARMRKQFLARGFDESTPPHQVLEMLLFYAIRVADTNETAHRLLDRFETVSNVLGAPYEELIQVPGINEVSACLLKMILPVTRYCSAERQKGDILLDDPDAVGKFLVDRFQGLREERALLLCMDGGCHVLSVERIADGDIDSVGISPRQVAQIALQLRSKVVVLAHNHPNGVALPSENDLAMTKLVRAALSSINIQLVDHIIVTEGDYVSMAQSKDYARLFSDEETSA